jgi:hypothetical protein
MKPDYYWSLPDPMEQWCHAGKIIVRGTATAGDGGTATAGDGGCISILYYNGQKYKRAIFEVGKNEIEPNQAYRVDAAGKPHKIPAPAPSAPTED